MTDKYDDTSVRVAVRIRPQLAKERIDMCQVCTQVTPGEPQVVLGKDKAFTYDYVFDIPAEQNAIYEDCSKSLIDGCFEGYNATIFAYGQTGSGKTYTMGTGFDVNAPPEEIGIIPRSVEHLFNGIEQRKREAVERGEPLPDFKVNAQFMELYNEEVLDLLDTTRDPAESRTHKSHIKIHEDAAGGIYTVGVTTRQVNSLQDTIQCLKVGALSRTTASTNMNAQSSRSHAIFTLFIKQQRVLHVEKEDFENEDADITDTNDTTIVNSQALNEFETLTAKFHFVDLAGSERLKRTGATGDRQKEGISINCGLLALGNVISALGDQTKKGSHVPYRDSKLTRLLQDSLGGNSRTVMIACISPSDRDFMETLNALKYANRARNIKNKLVANQDKTSKQIQGLRMEIQALQVELLDYKTGKRLVDADGVETVNDMFHENTMLQTENENLRQRIKGMHETVETLTSRNTQLLTERAAANVQNMGEGEEAEDAVKKLIEGYVGEVEELRARLIESESMMEVVKRQAARTPSRAHTVSPGHTSMSMSMSLTNTSLDMGLSDTADIIALAKKDLKHDKKQAKKHRTRKKSTSSDKENLSEDEKQDHEYREHDPSQEKDEGEGSEEEAELEDEEEEEDDGEMEESDSDSDSEDGLIALNKETKENVKNAADKNRILSTTTEEEEDADNLHEDLADLTCEISIKQKLVEELELSQKRLHTMKVSYEEKLTSLQNRIRQTEVERDSVLSNLGDIESHSQEKAKKIKDEFEKKINDMQTDLKKVQAAKKEHAKLLRNQSHYEKQLKTLQRDLGEMKKLKVKLMNQIKEETTKTRQVESRRNREVMALKKEQRAKDNQIKTLTTEKRQKEIVLRRKQEEVEALRKRSQQRTMSARVAGRVGRYDKPLTVPVAPVAPKKRRQTFNPKAAKSKWDNLEKSVSSIIVKKQTLSHMEQDMERWIKQRESLSKRLEKFVKKKEHAIAKKEEESFIKDLEDQIDSLKDNIVFVQDNINECQSNIMQMEEAKAEEDDMKPLSVCNDVTLDEAKYLLEHFVSLAINKGLLASQKDSENKELMAKLHQERMDSTFQREMLQYLIQDKVDIEIDDSMLTRETQDSDSGSNNSSRSNSPIDSKLTKVVTSPSSPKNMAKLLSDFMESQGQLQATNQMAGSNIGNMPVAGAAMSSSVAGSPGALPNPVLSGPLQTSVDSINTSTSSIGGTRLKARRHKTTPADLLGFALAGPVVGAEGLSPTLSPLVAVPEEKKITPLASPGPSRPATASQRSSERPSSASQRTSQSDTSTSSHNGMVADTATTLPPPKAPPRRNSPRTSTSNPTTESHIPRADGGGRPDPAPSPSLIRRGSYTKLDPSSPVMKRKMTSSTTAPGSLSRQSSINDTSDLSPPSSPSMARRNRDNNVFSRLTSQATPASPHPTRGVIAPAKTGLAYRTSPLIHTHTAGGHTKAVLSVYATEDLLFSSSKDRTAKIWDLATGEEILTLDGHPNNVVSVKYSEDTNLAYTVSTYFIKVWDPRQGNKCIKTLTSAGLTNEGPGPQLGFNARQLTCPPGEININDVALNSTGSVLYSAAGNTVRIWDLHSFKSVGKLSGGHQAAVMVLAVDDTDTADGNICVVTGSKDHYIKIFDVMEDSQGVLCPKYNLEPPHYDGIQSLCLMGDLLFSGSRDMCIKKWDLADQQLKQTMINAHKDWICGLSFMPGGNCLLSGCRGGYLKLWHIDNCTPLGEIQAHKSPINAICTNNRMIFTASNETGVKFWYPDYDRMPKSVQEYYI